MIVGPQTPERLLHVVRNLREADRDEIYALREHRDPQRIVAEVMARAQFAWVMDWRGEPTVALGGTEMWPGVWSIHCFGTDNWSRLALPLTKFVRRTMLPTLFNQLHAHRLEADSLSTHTQAHRWMEICGARREAVRQARGRHGEDFFTYVVIRGVDWTP